MDEPGRTKGITHMPNVNASSRLIVYEINWIYVCKQIWIKPVRYIKVKAIDARKETYQAKIKWLFVCLLLPPA